MAMDYRIRIDHTISMFDRYLEAFVQHVHENARGGLGWQGVEGQQRSMLYPTLLAPLELQSRFGDKTV